MSTPASTSVPSALEVTDEQVEDLRRRLRATRRPDAEAVDDWSQGIPSSYLQELAAYWATSTTWVDSRVA